MKKVFEYMSWPYDIYKSQKFLNRGIDHPLHGNDMVAAINKMRIRVDWDCFYEYYLEYVLEHFPKTTKMDNRAWLFGNPANFFKLMEEWLNEEAD